MNRNVGTVDRNVRIAIGALLGVLSLATLGSLVPLPAVVAPVFGVLALILLATGSMGFCGLYSLLGVSTDR